MSLVQLTFYRTLSLSIYIYKSLESVKSKTFKIHRLIQADWIAFIFLKTGKMSEEGVLDYSSRFRNRSSPDSRRNNNKITRVQPSG